ncbi:MAG: hypothetical protein H6944_14265 [Zoogloeaceae bacterium]|nr:hypothetical protein [Zoogloeaceae bacterium]
MFSEVETFVDIAEWARHKGTWPSRFLRQDNGLPSHDTLNPVHMVSAFATEAGLVLAQHEGRADPRALRRLSAGDQRQPARPAPGAR